MRQPAPCDAPGMVRIGLAPLGAAIGTAAPQGLNVALKVDPSQAVSVTATGRH
jgi:hypothetical protein